MSASEKLRHRIGIVLLVLSIVMQPLLMILPAAAEVPITSELPVPVVLNVTSLDHAEELNVAQHEVVVLDFSNTESLTLPGNINVSGKLYGMSTNSAFSTAAFSAANFVVNHGAEFSTSLPSDLRQSFPTAIPSLNLILNAVQNIINQGTISSSGNLTAAAGGSITNALAPGITGSAPIMQAVNNVNLTSNIGNIVNSGTITAATGNLNITSQVVHDLVVNNIGGRLEALQGTFNVRDSLFTDKAHLTISGGEVLTRQLNLHSGNGIAKVDLNEVKGQLNVFAGEAYITSRLGELRFGQMQITGDPIIHGESVVLGSMQVADNLLVLSRQGVSAEPGTSIYAPAGMSIRAGVDYSIASDGSTSFSNSGYEGSVDLSNVLSLKTGNSPLDIFANGEIRMPDSTEATGVALHSTPSSPGATSDIYLGDIASKANLFVVSTAGSINLNEGSAVSTKGIINMRAPSGTINFEEGVYVHTEFGTARFEAASPYTSDPSIMAFAPQVAGVLTVNGSLAGSSGGLGGQDFTVSHLLEHSEPGNQANVNNRVLVLSGEIALGGGVNFAIGFPEAGIPPAMTPPPSAGGPTPNPPPNVSPTPQNPPGSQLPIVLPPSQPIGPAPSVPAPVIPPATGNPGSGAAPNDPPTITWVDLDFNQQGSVVVKNQDGETVNEYFPGLSQASQGDLSLHLVLETLSGTPVNNLSIQDDVSLSYSPSAFPELSITGTFRSESGGKFVTSVNSTDDLTPKVSASNFHLDGSTIFGDNIQLVAFESFHNGGTIEAEKSFVVNAKTISTTGSITAKTGDVVLSSATSINLNHDVATLAQGGKITLKTGTAAQDALTLSTGKQVVAGGNVIINAHIVNLADGIDQEKRTAIASLNGSVTFQSCLESRQLVINPGRNTTVYGAININLNDSRGLAPELDAPGAITINGGPGKGTFFAKEGIVYFYGGANGAVKVALDSLPSFNGLLAKDALINVNRGSLDIYGTTTGSLSIVNGQGSIKVAGKISSGDGVTISAPQGAIKVTENQAIAGSGAVVINSPELVLNQGAIIQGATVNIQSTTELSISFESNSAIVAESSLNFGPNGGPLSLSGGPDRHGRLLAPNGQVTLSGLPISVNIKEIQGSLVLQGASANAAVPAIDVNVTSGNLKVASAFANSGDIALSLHGEGSLVVIEAKAQNGNVKLLALNSNLTVANASSAEGIVALKSGFGPNNSLSILNNGTVTGKFISIDTSILLADGNIQSSFGNIDISSPDFNNQLPLKIILGANGKITTPATSGAISISGSEIELRGGNVNELISSAMTVSIKTTADNNNRQGPVDVNVRTIIGKADVSGSHVSLTTHCGDLELNGLTGDESVSVIANGGNLTLPMLSSSGAIEAIAAGNISTSAIFGGLGPVTILAGSTGGPGQIATGKLIAPQTTVSLTALKGRVTVDGDIDAAPGGFSANGGHLNILAEKDILINGKIDTSGREGNPGFNAGNIMLTSTSGDISVSRQIVARGGAGNGWTPSGLVPATGGNGGNLTLDARNGKVSVSTIDVSGGKGAAGAAGGTAGKVTIISQQVEPNEFNASGLASDDAGNQFVSSTDSATAISIYANSLYVRTQGDWTAQDLRTGALDIQSTDGSIRILSIDTRAIMPDGNADLSRVGQPVSLVAGKEIAVDGSIITNGGNVQIAAGKDLKVATIDSTRAIDISQTLNSAGLVSLSSATKINVTGAATIVKSAGDTNLSAPEISIGAESVIDSGANLNLRTNNLIVAGKLSSSSGTNIMGAAGNGQLNIVLLGEGSQIKSGSTVEISNQGSITIGGNTIISLGGQPVLAPDASRGQIEGSAIKVLSGPQSSVTIKAGLLSGPLSVVTGGADIYTPNKLLVETLVTGSSPANVEARDLTVNQIIGLSDVNLRAADQIALKSGGKVESADNLRLSSAAIMLGAGAQAAAGQIVDLKTASLTMDSGSSIGTDVQSTQTIVINNLPQETELAIGMNNATMGCAGCTVIIGSSALGSLTIDGTGKFAYNANLKLFTGKPTEESSGEMRIAYARMESNTFVSSAGALQMTQSLSTGDEGSTLNLDTVSSGSSVTLEHQLGSIKIGTLNATQAVRISDSDTAAEIKISDLVSARNVDITAQTGKISISRINSGGKLAITAPDLTVNDVKGSTIVFNTDNLLVTWQIKAQGGDVVVNSAGDLTVTLPAWPVPFSSAKGYTRIVSESVPTSGAGFVGGAIEFNAANSLNVAGFLTVPEHLRHQFIAAEAGEITAEQGVYFNAPNISVDKLQEVAGPLSFGGAAPIKSIHVSTEKGLSLAKIGSTAQAANVIIETASGHITADQPIVLNWLELLGQTDRISLKAKVGDVKVAGVSLASGDYENQATGVIFAGKIQVLSSKPANEIPAHLIPQLQPPLQDDDGPGIPSSNSGSSSIRTLTPSASGESSITESLKPTQTPQLASPNDRFESQPSSSSSVLPLSNESETTVTRKDLSMPSSISNSNSTVIAPALMQSVMLNIQSSTTTDQKSQKNSKKNNPIAVKGTTLSTRTSAKAGIRRSGFSYTAGK